MSPEWILGIWDGHDAGCALVRGDEVVFAVNEERLTRRKLEIGFPKKSIQATLKWTGLKEGEIQSVAFSTGDFAKTLSRAFPSLQENYYLLRRRKSGPGRFSELKKSVKYRLTEFPPTALSRALSRRLVGTELKKLGFSSVTRLALVGHHEAHAATAAFTSGFDDCLVLTLDGIGDGLSGSAWIFKSGALNPVGTIPGNASLGIFFEHVTTLLNMRELEDEGKVMALACYMEPTPDTENPMLDFFRVEGLDIRARFGALEMRDRLKALLWSRSAEQFSFLAQRTLEVVVLKWIRNLLEKTGKNRIAISGGVASNVKLNMLIREMPEIEELSVFPHMGDGGQALGAALWLNFEKNGISRYFLKDLYLGPGYSESDILSELSQCEGLSFHKTDRIWEEAATALSQGRILFWFEGRMEYGPRALGARSILALPNSTEIRDLLNRKLKKRSWFQPYCPVMLEKDSEALLDPGSEKQNGRPNEFMTCAYRASLAGAKQLTGVLGVDGTCRPQILREGRTETRYQKLLHAVRVKTGMGALLNTSFNLHGEPLVCAPGDALRTFLKSDIPWMVMDDFWIEKKQSN